MWEEDRPRKSKYALVLWGEPNSLGGTQIVKVLEVLYLKGPDGSKPGGY
jgi:hypothetical protein